MGEAAKKEATLDAMNSLIKFCYKKEKEAYAKGKGPKPKPLDKELAKEVKKEEKTPKESKKVDKDPFRKEIKGFFTKDLKTDTEPFQIGGSHRAGRKGVLNSDAPRRKRRRRSNKKV